MLLLKDIKSQQIPPAALTKQKLLITGPVGVGKTTIAKALAARWLGVEAVMEAQPSLRKLEDAYPFDVVVIDCGVDGIDRVREIAAMARQAPFNPDCRARAFILDEIHALPEKAVQGLLCPIDNDTQNFWAAITSRPASQLDSALRSRLSYHLALGAADVAAVLRHSGADAASADAAAKRAQGDLRLAFNGNETEAAIDPEVAIQRTQQGLRLGCNARKLFVAALRNPFAVQALLLDGTFDCPSVHLGLCVVLSPRNDIAAHQLVAACRKAGLLGSL